MAAASAVSAIPGLGMGVGGLMMKTNKLAKAGRVIKTVSKMTQGGMGVVAGIEMAQVGFTNFLNGLESGTLDGKSIAMMFGGAFIAGLSGKGMASSGKALMTCTESAGRAAKGKGWLTDGDVSGKPIGEALNSNIYYHSCGDSVAYIIADTGFRTDIPNVVDAFHNNRYGRGVYLADSPATALAERPGGTILKVTANKGRNLDITSRGVIGGDDYTMTHAIARGARKHGYDSITFMSAKNPNGINTVIFNPANVKVEEVLK